MEILTTAIQIFARSCGMVEFGVAMDTAIPYANFRSAFPSECLFVPPSVCLRANH